MEDMIIIRPPVEANSLLVGVTEGCWWNQCRFCGVYINQLTGEIIQKYRIRPIERVFKELEILKQRYGDFISTLFMAGGEALSAPTDHLLKILHKINELFPHLKRISCYAKNLDILRKSDEELRQLHEAGLTICYMGLESGSRRILKMMKKGTTPENMIKAGKKLMKAGIQLSVYIILGLGGVEYSEEHAIETANVLNQMNPTIFRFRTLNIMPTSELWKDIQEGKFEIVSPYGILKEQLTIFKHLNDSVTSYVFNDHVSNYDSFEAKLPDEREFIIRYLEARLRDPATKRLRHKGLLHM
ncbi:MAG: B12-binding domain-containing radical SAM protein [Candidatus Helarchaeota archaeon]